MSGLQPLSATWRDADELRRLGDLRAARDLLEPAADGAAIDLGPEHPDVIETLRRLATVHRELDQLPQARRVLEEALDNGLVRWPDDNPVILAISAELGAISDELGNRHEARRHLLRVARFGPSVLGPDHPYVRAAQRYVGGTAPQPEPPPPHYPDSQLPPDYPDSGPPYPGPHTAPGAEPAWPDEYPTEDPQNQAPPGLPPDPPYGGRVSTSLRGRVTPPDQVGNVGTAGDATTRQGGSPAPATGPPPYEPGVYRPKRAGGWGPVPAKKVEPAQAAVYRPGTPVVPPHQTPSPFRPGPDYDGGHRSSRAPLIVLAVMAVAAAIAGVVFAVVALSGTHGSTTAQPPAATATTAPSPTPSPSPSVTIAPVLTLRDGAGTVTLTWTDPSGGRTPFVVSGGVAGGRAQPFPPLTPGTTTYALNGLNPKLDYCFTVGAVYNTDTIALSPLVCTRRTGGASNSPSR